ncbi:MAG: chemotaxis protein CheW [Nitrospirae bacterium]|nr:chemotaxis protein CheW [Candidatus Manganitrophaceae bacterium]
MSSFKGIENKNEPSATQRRIVHFFVAGEEYGVPIESVKEIIYAKSIRPLPGAANGIEGIIDLRGRVVPVIDLRKKLKASSAAESAQHILILDVRRQKIGLLVDRVVQVMVIGEEIQSVEAILDKNAPYIKGVYRMNTQLIVLLGLEQLWTEMELSQIESALSRG